MPGPNSCPISPEFDFLDATLNLERLPVAELAEFRKSEPMSVSSTHLTLPTIF